VYDRIVPGELIEGTGWRNADAKHKISLLPDEFTAFLEDHDPSTTITYSTVNVGVSLIGGTSGVGGGVSVGWSYTAPSVVIYDMTIGNDPNWWHNIDEGADVGSGG